MIAYCMQTGSDLTRRRGRRISISISLSISISIGISISIIMIMIIKLVGGWCLIPAPGPLLLAYRSLLACPRRPWSKWSAGSYDFYQAVL